MITFYFVPGMKGVMYTLTTPCLSKVDEYLDLVRVSNIDDCKCLFFIEGQFKKKISMVRFRVRVLLYTLKKKEFKSSLCMFIKLHVNMRGKKGKLS